MPTPLPEEGGGNFVFLMIARDGGARRDRTDDLMLAKHALYQLSYGPLRAPVALRRAASAADSPLITVETVVRQGKAGW